MFVLRAALIVLAATALSAGALAQSKPSPAKKSPAQTATQQQDQSYLFLSPSSGTANTPNYMVSGTRRSDQPYYGTHVDRFGMRQIER